MRPCKRSLVVVAAVARLCAAAGTMRLSWTTDLDDDFPEGSIGPDGPWQALGVYVGDDDSDGQKYGVPVALWPTTSDSSHIPTVDGSGNYSVDDSDSASSRRGTHSLNMYDFTLDGYTYSDLITFPEKDGDTPEETNGTVVAAYEYYQELQNGTQFNQSVGILGLGPDLDSERARRDRRPSLLEQLKEDGKISSVSYSMHLGSVEFDQPGSLVLGGYEQNRVIGKAGVFAQADDNPVMPSTPLMSLLDVVLGVEQGGSPFDSDDPISVFSGLDDQTLDESLRETYKELDGPPGSVLVMPNPAVPYIYLPPGTCEKAQQRLPINYYPDIGFYLWNTSDPQYERIISSPAYLGFTFSDMSDDELTIKVPFQLLNLMLTPPLVNKPMAYFPCRTDNDGVYGMWSLGRAFLQAAVLAVDFDGNRTYLAQAAGPGMTGSKIKEFADDDFSIEGTGIGLGASWREHWTVLPGGEDSGGGLSAGAIAGIVIGAVVLLGAVAVAIFFWRKRRAGKTVAAADDEKPPLRRTWVSWWKGAEAQGNPVVELDAPRALHEAPGKQLAHEMAAVSHPVEMPASPVK